MSSRDYRGGESSGGAVPAFLTKLWTLVEDPSTNELIFWSTNGASFHVYDQARFAKEVLPKFFKHNNMASFVRQLNMYGFRKVMNVESGGLKADRDDMEFSHQNFIRGKPNLLEQIKRKVGPPVSVVKSDDLRLRHEDMSRVLNDVKVMRGKQETIDTRLHSMKQENEALWREVASLRQKHHKQQQIVNKLIQFLVTLVQPSRRIGIKRRTLAIEDSYGDAMPSTSKVPRYSRQLSLHNTSEAEPFMNQPQEPQQVSPSSSGPIISDITDLASFSGQGMPTVTLPTSPPGGSSSGPAVTPPPPPYSEAPGTSASSVQTASSLPAPTSLPFTPTSVTSSLGADMAGVPSEGLMDEAFSPTAFMQGLAEGTLTVQEEPQDMSIAVHSSPPKQLGRCVQPSCTRQDVDFHVDTIQSSLDSIQSLLQSGNFSLDASQLTDVFNLLPNEPSILMSDSTDWRPHTLEANRAGFVLPESSHGQALLDSLSEVHTRNEQDLASLESSEAAGKELIEYAPANIDDMPSLFDNLDEDEDPEFFNKVIAGDAGKGDAGK
ncbi:PREDICTED: heat shock factor protein-like isoform X2 [Branchiostoma belcheri]|uniref:Heat shock factor protein-like isoform X2 n=1 Tax=Branchiostoma belcheri TaxID=7741 RepID=A0A6P4Z6H6_BRABE|nr:PREDICTED: heat shock factor protein-like isoform X2 [Branchiostoma belcheri]